MLCQECLLSSVTTVRHRCRHCPQIKLAMCADNRMAARTAASALSARRDRPPAPFLLRRLRRAGAGDGDSHPSDRDGELDGGVAWSRTQGRNDSKLFGDP